MEGEEMRSRVERAEEAALKEYPQPKELGRVGVIDWLKEYRREFIKGYEQAEKDILSIIQSRLEEICGDAQPRPVLRIELQEIINKIKNGDN